MFELSYPSEDYIFHPCVVEGKNPITGFGNLFYEDIYKPLYALGLAWDFNDPPDNLVLGSHPSTSIGDPKVKKNNLEVPNEPKD